MWEVSRYTDCVVPYFLRVVSMYSINLEEKKIHLGNGKPKSNRDFQSFFLNKETGERIISVIIYDV